MAAGIPGLTHHGESQDLFRSPDAILPIPKAGRERISR